MIRKTCITMALGLALFACKASAGDASGKDKFGSLSVDQVEQLIAKKDADIYDNNGQDDWVKEHVPTAKWVKFNGVTANDLPQDKTRKLVFYCANSH